MKDTGFKLWLDDYIDIMEFEVKENEIEYPPEVSLDRLEDLKDLEYNHGYYELGYEHGEQAGILSTLRLIRSKL